MPSNLVGNTSICMIGAGGIGSPTALCLSKMGVGRLTLYDADTVEVHNLPNQMYREADMGRAKVEALADICRQFAPGVIVDPRADEFGKDTPMPPPGTIVVSGVDSMTARTLIWDRIKYNPAVPLYIEGRMGGQTGRIYAIRPTSPEQVAFYERNLYSDEDADPTPCTERAISYNVFALAAYIAAIVKKHIVGETVQRELLLDMAGTAVFCSKD